jgi:hypothetical protein
MFRASQSVVRPVADSVQKSQASALIQSLPYNDTDLVHPPGISFAVSKRSMSLEEILLCHILRNGYDLPARS